MQYLQFSNGEKRRKLFFGRNNKKGDTPMSLPNILRQQFQFWMQYCENVRELQSCTDRELGDLGLSRDDIRRVAREAAYTHA